MQVTITIEDTHPQFRPILKLLNNVVGEAAFEADKAEAPKATRKPKEIVEAAPAAEAKAETVTPKAEAPVVAKAAETAPAAEITEANLDYAVHIRPLVLKVSAKDRNALMNLFGEFAVTSATQLEASQFYAFYVQLKALADKLGVAA